MLEADKQYYVEIFEGGRNINQQFLLPRRKLNTKFASPGNPPDKLPYYPSKHEKEVKESESGK